MRPKIRPRCLKATPASEYVGISRRYLTQLSQEGKIPFSKIGTRTYLYDIADLDDFIDSRKVGGGQ
ncbi:helix-turn-helix domain-containing protein [Pontiellaceae bacterium B12227]|nr:helix-turn-helix domain-containing protein [Pontiellaceae bacterium B12227]